jgi:hypothetical protein
MSKSKRARMKLGLGRLVLLMIALLAIGCSIESPQAPSWDVDLVIPVINRTFTATELLEHISSELVAVDSSGDLFFSLRETLDSVQIDTLLHLDDLSSSVVRQVDEFMLTLPAPQAQAIQIIDHLPLAAGIAPDTGIVVALPLTGFGSIQEAQISAGQLEIEVTNNTNLDIDSLTCRLQDNLYGQEILTQSFPSGIAAGASAQQISAVAGKTLTDDLTLEVYFHTPGGNTGSLAGQQIEFELRFVDSLVVASATASVDPFAVDYIHTVRLNTEHHLESARLAAGELHYQVNNQLPLAAHLEITLLQITSDGEPLQFGLDLPAKGEAAATIDLAGWDVAPAADSLAALIQADLLGSGGGVVTVMAADGFEFDLTLTNVRLESAAAIIAPTEVNWQEQTFELDIPNGLDNIALTAAELKLEIHNGSELPANLEILIEADNGHQLTLSGVISAGSVSNPTITTILSTEVADLLSPVPQVLRISGVAVVGNGSSRVILSEQDHFFAEAKISAPLQVVLGADTIDADIEAVDIDEDIRERVDRLHSGDFFGTLTSHLPLGATVTIYLDTDSASLYTSPLLEIGPLTLAAGSTDANGIVTGTATTDNEINLSGDDFQIFSNPCVFVGARLEFPGTAGDTVRLRGDDFLHIGGRVTISARVGGEDF